ncbi:NAD(P)-dependent glycerol-3-phosphate dehydrogenase [Candidatus Acetothermia bacterium]|nr:NAD(P)-dependent glycerol-3-phosphate dehydrogenase [Candidatus Acetothermia bacterium]MCI2427738.1 NAD(P)-dependent glycerol-3-phosphate dehydrogenase [Candidatus Acetothermia bacterium]MCI2428809.1 NAD(P)-dependent glycerol-3-phosphate dehydrogenase [Candidatus Acetothermia bacterium]
MHLSVIGAGGWGSAFARVTAKSGHNVILWVRDPVNASAIDRLRENRRYLPGVILPDNLRITASLKEAIGSEILVLAVPSFAVREMVEKISALPASRDRKIFINLAKGLDRTSGKRLSTVIEETAGPKAVFTLAGPSHAEEVGRDMPTAVVLAGKDLALGKELQRSLSTPRFRIYLSDDIKGVEYCSTIKNIIAIATGVADGLGYGDNSRGAVVTRGLAEMVLFGRVFDIREETLFGLSGLGDLVATCTSNHSRNRRVGYQIGQGEPIADILRQMTMVAEGVYATEIIHRLAIREELEMPITEAVYHLLYKKGDPATIVDALMTRPLKRE